MRQKLVNGSETRLPARTLHLPGFVLTVGVHPARSTLPRHIHDDPTICYVLRGRFTEFSVGRATDCESETLKLTPAGDPHWNKFSDVDTCGLRIDVDRGRFASSPSIFRALDERYHRHGGSASALARRLITALSDDADDIGALTAEGLALELVAEVSRDTNGSSTARWLIQADELIHESYTQRWTLNDIAAAVGVQPATLARAFRRRFGCTVGECIRQLRVDHAAWALVETTAPLTDVALSAGFYDQSHLTNVFRRHMGVTPAAYRARGGLHTRAPRVKAS